MQCGRGCGYAWWHHVTEWVVWGLPPLLPHSRTRERKRSVGGFQCTSLFASASKGDLHSMLVCLCECVNGWICPHLPVLPIELWCWGEEEVGRRHSNRGRAGLIGRAEVVGDPVKRCAVCAEWDMKGLWWSFKGGPGLVEDWGLWGHSRSQSERGPILSLRPRKLCGRLFLHLYFCVLSC